MGYDTPSHPGGMGRCLAVGQTQERHWPPLNYRFHVVVVLVFRAWKRPGIPERQMVSSPAGRNVVARDWPDFGQNLANAPARFPPSP